MHAQGIGTGRQRFPALPSVTLTYCLSSGTHNGLSSSLRAPGLIAKVDEKSPHYVFQIKDRAFLEAKHSATRNKGCNLKGRSEVLKQDKYYKHRVNMMCVIQNYKKQDIQRGEVVTSRCHGSINFWMTTNRKRHSKSEIRTVSNFIDLIQFHFICQMLAKFSGIGSERALSKFYRKRKKHCVALTYRV